MTLFRELTLTDQLFPIKLCMTKVTTRLQFHTSSSITLSCDRAMRMIKYLLSLPTKFAVDQDVIPVGLIHSFQTKQLLLPAIM